MRGQLNLKIEHEDKYLSIMKLISTLGFRKGLLISIGLIQKAELTDDDYTRALKKDEKLFWGLVKKDYKKRNPNLVASKLAEFEESCAYLRWAMGICGHKWLISGMRKKLGSEIRNVKDMCVYDVIEKYNHYVGIVMI